MTYSQLQNDVITYSARDDVAAIVPTFIRLAQREINRRVRIMEQETALALGFAAPDYEVTLPSDFQGFKRLSLADSPNPKCRYVGPDQFASLAQLSPANFYEIRGDAELIYTIEGYKVRVYQPAGAVSSFVINSVYYKAYPDFVDNTDTHALLITHYDLYLWASLKQLWAWADEVESEAKFEAKMTTVIGQIDAYENTRRRIPGSAERVPSNRRVII